MDTPTSFTAIIGIAITGLTAFFIAQSFAGMSPYETTVDFTDSGHTYDNLEGRLNPDTGNVYVAVAPPNSNGTLTTRNYLEGEKGTVTDISGFLDYFETGQIVEITANQYDSGDSLISSETVDFNASGENAETLSTPLNVSTDEYVNFEVYMER